MLPLRFPIPERFQIVRQIGEGGMGAVYEAIDVERNVRVALKTVLHRDPDALARFKREFRSLQDIHHPNLVALGELVGDANGTFFTMELIEGSDLRAWISGDARDVGDSARLGGPTALDLPRVDPHDTDRDAGLTASSGSNASANSADMNTPPQASHKRPSTMPRPLPRSGESKFDEARLRDAFRQIATGLSALHEAGKIHRDVKPSNVRVTHDGRVVLLDFGLVFDVDAENAVTDTNVVGTPAYMAPEQALSEPVGPEADWYAVGAMLYLCLTGRLPFEGAAVAVMMAKHYQEPPAPSTIAPSVPRDLEQLAMDLLQFEPSARPTGAEVARRLSLRSSRPPKPSSRERLPPTVPFNAPFIGRDSELGTLRRALEDVGPRTRTVAVVLHGESGVGKSALARRFLDDAKEEGALVLQGRCYEREAVPYKAFDEVIDALSRRLARMPKEDALALLPSRVEVLAQLFPALARVPVVAQAAGTLDRDPHERRRGAFRALRELLRKVATKHTLVIAIDDLQWTDADSLSLLGEILRPPDAPPLLLVVTMRGTEGATNPSAPPKLAAQIPGDVRTIHVGRLAKEDARNLATKLLEREVGVSHADAAAIAREADGHPLFIDELVRHAAAHSARAREDGAPANLIRLDDALWTRVERLDLAARRILEVACVLGAPVAQEVVATAAALEMGEFARAVAVLRNANLVRTRGARVTDALEAFHDRVREAVASRMDPDAKRECHARVASALELAKGSDPEVLATHWSAAGEPAKAARHAIGAAEQAVQALAFDRAARLFQRAIDLVPAADPRLRVLRENLGDALANAGDGVRAAQEYTRAAEGANPEGALDLRRRAAEQLLRAGEVQRGLAATREVLTSVGLTMPRTRLGVIVTLIWYRLLVRLRGLGYVPRDAKDVPQSDLTRIDICWSVSCTTTNADAFSGALYQALHLRLALRAGERRRVIRALAIEAAFVGAAGAYATPRAAKVLGLARDAAKGLSDPYIDAILLLSEGLSHVFAFRFALAHGVLERSIETLVARCPGTDWEIATARYFSFIAQFFTCQFTTMRAAQETALKEAVERGDRYASVMLRVGTTNRNWLVSGDPVRARRELDAALREWPKHPFHVVHYYALVADAYIALYEGEPDRAAERIAATRGELRRSMLLELEGPRLEYAGICGRVALAMAAKDAREGRKPRFGEVNRCIRLFKRRGGPVGAVAVKSFEAGHAAVRGARAEALAHLEDLAREDSDETWLGANCARWVAGKMHGGPDGDARAAAAVAALESRGVRVGKPLIAAQLPGLESYV